MLVRERPCLQALEKMQHPCCPQRPAEGGKVQRPAEGVQQKEQAGEPYVWAKLHSGEGAEAASRYLRQQLEQVRRPLTPNDPAAQKPPAVLEPGERALTQPASSLPLPSLLPRRLQH